MDFTFGIVTHQRKPLEALKQIIDSIKDLNIPNYEIVIIGGDSDIIEDNIKVLKFQEISQGGWITKKKNIITQIAKYENIVYTHDYIYFDKDWYKNFISFGNDFHLCMNQILNLDGSRYRDWTLWADAVDLIGIQRAHLLLPYDIKYLSRLMYFSGAYWVAKKNIMEEFPLNEYLLWGQGEDVEWSKRITKKYNFSINEKSIVKLIKNKDVVFSLCHQMDMEKINALNNSKAFHNT